MRACVIVPARNEEALIAGCLHALAHQTGLDRDDYEVILVLDRCTDATEQRAQEADPRVRIVHASEPGVGHARRLGMDLAAERLPPDGLIATTDADSRPAPDWLANQLHAVANGARAIGGRIELDQHDLPDAVIERRRQDARRRFEALKGPGAREHHQFSGASLSVTAATYAQVGRLEPREALEDEGFERALRRHGIPIERLASVRVTTSGRLIGRAPRGLAVDLQRADWLARRRFRAADYTLEQLVQSKDRTISLILPARNTQDTIGPILQTLKPLEPLIDELLIVDGSDVPLRADAWIEREDDLLPEFGPSLGKGDAMWRGLAATSGELVAYLDTDTEDFTPAFVLGLLGPLLTQPVAFVKGAFRRPFRTGQSIEPEGGGRVTELLARPYLNLHVPALAGFRQPLAGELAAHRSVLERLSFPAGYGVEIAMMIDVLREVGLDRMAEVDLGTRQNRHQSLSALSVMALEVLAAGERRVHGTDPAASLLVPAGEDFEVRSPSSDERPSLASLRALATSG